MPVRYFEDAASTSPAEPPALIDKGATSTAPPPDIAGGRIFTPAKWLATVVLGAALTAGGAQGAFAIEELYRRRYGDISESSTAPLEVDEVLVRRVGELFEEGASEFFHDGLYSSFSRELLRMLERDGQMAVRAIADYLYSGDPKPDVVSEALRWLAGFDDPSTLSQRWAILRHALRDRSPRVRDGAILGFAALDDSRARPLLLEARDLERIDELRALIDQVVAQLERPRRDAAVTPNS